MSAIVNDRDVLLRGAATRYDSTGIGVLLGASSPTIRAATDGSVTPASIFFTALQLGAPGPVTWTASNGTLAGTDNNGRILDAASVTADSVVVTAKVTYNGVTYASSYTVLRVRDGVTGPAGATGPAGPAGATGATGGTGPMGPAGVRGAGHFYASGTSWSDAVANAATPGDNVVDDVVTISDGGTFVMEKCWSGTAWVPRGTVLDGSLLVTGSVKAAAIDSTGLVIRDQNGNVILGAGTGLDWQKWIANKPTSLAGINTTESTKLKEIQAGATNGATFGTNISGQINASNIGVYIAKGAIGSAYIGNLSASNITSGTLTTASINIPSAASGAALNVTYGSNNVGYHTLSGYNIVCTALAAPGTGAIDAQATPGSGHGLVGFGDYSFYSANGTVGPFTGSHDALFPDDATYCTGDIVVDVQVMARKDISNTIFEVAPSTQTRQKGVVGVLAADGGPLSRNAPTAMVVAYKQPAEMQDDLGDIVYVDQNEYVAEYDQYRDSHRLVIVNALGEGQINVCGEGGDIAPGDLIVTSSLPGKGMRQDDDVIRSYTVAKAREHVSFASPTDVRQIACIYLAG